MHSAPNFRHAIVSLPDRCHQAHSLERVLAFAGPSLGALNDLT